MFMLCIFIQTKINRMTSYEAHLFNQLLEVNWRINNGNYDSIIRMALIRHYSEIVAQLEDSMGEAEWKSFVSTGRQMFAPKGGYGDESPEEVERMYASI